MRYQAIHHARSTEHIDRFCERLVSALRGWFNTQKSTVVDELKVQRRNTLKYQLTKCYLRKLLRHVRLFFSSFLLYLYQYFINLKYIYIYLRSCVDYKIQRI
jgi:hypothetical protein